MFKSIYIHILNENMLKHYISKPNDPSESDIKKKFITIEGIITIYSCFMCNWATVKTIFPRYQG